MNLITQATLTNLQRLDETSWRVGSLQHLQAASCHFRSARCLSRHYSSLSQLAAACQKLSREREYALVRLSATHDGRALIRSCKPMTIRVNAFLTLCRTIKGNFERSACSLSAVITNVYQLTKWERLNIFQSPLKILDNHIVERLRTAMR